MNSYSIIEHELQKNLKWESMKLGKTIGEGTHGVCYLCTDLKTNRTYAAKIITFDGSVARRQHILKEIKLLNHLNKFQVETVFPKFYGYVYYVSKATNEHFYALICEKADGDLKTLLEQRKDGLTYKENLALLGCLGKCLLFMNRQKMVHGDLKPGNILYFINEDSEINFKIGDFGEGELKAGSRITVRGSLKYFSPEMNFSYLNNIEMMKSEKSDIYSAGLVMLAVNLKNLNFFESNYENQFRKLEEKCNPWQTKKGPYDEKLMMAMKQVLDIFPGLKAKEKRIFGEILENSLKYNPLRRCKPQEFEDLITNLTSFYESETESEEEKTEKRKYIHVPIFKNNLYNFSLEIHPKQNFERGSQ